MDGLYRWKHQEVCLSTIKQLTWKIMTQKADPVLVGIR